MTTQDLSKLRDYERPDIAKRFFRETEHHELTILHDDGLYRHLRMMPPSPKSSSYWYDVITTPHNLFFRGDGESYAFSRTKDMLEFFRSGVYKDGSLHINTTYWAEKLTSNRECVKTYDDEKFSKYVKEILAECEESWPGLTKAWEEATEGFMASYDITHEEGAWEALRDFEFGDRWIVKCSCGAGSEQEGRYEAQAWGRDNGHLHSNNAPKPGHKLDFTTRDAFTFDLCDMDFKDYNWWFLWSLYGILKAIQEYDRVKGYGPAEDVASAAKPVYDITTLGRPVHV